MIFCYSAKRKEGRKMKNKIASNQKKARINVLIEKTKEGEFVAEYPSIKDASIQTGIWRQSIGSAWWIHLEI